MKKITIWVLVGVGVVMLVTATAVYLVYYQGRDSVQNETLPNLVAEETSLASEVGDEIFTNSQGQEWRIPETVEFSVSSGRDDALKFWSGKIDPLKVHPGDTQNMRIVVSSKTSIVSVQADIETDNGRQLVDLSLTGKEEENEVLKEVWEGSWLVNDTSVRDYETIFTATDSTGDEKEMVLAWSDPCVLINGKELPYSGNSTISGDCSISSAYGLDNGNLTVGPGVTVTVAGTPGSTATLVFNPGKSLTNNGQITISNYAQMKKTYLWVKDADGDGYTTSLLSDRTFSDSPTTPPITGYRRQKDMVNAYTGNLLITDCDVSNSSYYHYLTGYRDADLDTYTVGSAQAICSGASLPSGWVSSSAGTDCDDSNASYYKYYTGYTDADNDGYRPYGYTTSSTICGGASFPVNIGWTQNTSGVDCLDSNFDVRPGQINWFSTAASGAPLSGWDYNCSGTVEYRYPTVAVNACVSAQNMQTNYIRVGTTDYSLACYSSHCGLRYLGGTSFSCHDGGVSTGCIAPFTACTTASSAAERH